MLLQNLRRKKEDLAEMAASPVVLLYGDDAYQLERTANALIKQTVTQFQDFNLFCVDGRTAMDVDKIADSALSLPFMAERRAVIIDDLDVSVLSAVDAEKLWQLLASLSPSTLLLITVRTQPLDLKKKGSRGQKLHDLCDKAGVVCSFTRPTRSDAARLAASFAAKHGTKLESPQGLLLADYCGCDCLRIQNEVDKLCAYAGEGETITQQQIQLLVEPVSEARIFDLSDKIIKRDYNGAMAVVDGLLFQRETPVAILTILTMAFVDMYRAACAKAEGLPDSEARSAFGYGGGAYRYTKAVENQRRVGSSCLGEILHLLAEADLAMKTTGIDPRLTLESTIAEIFLKMSRAAKNPV